MNHNQYLAKQWRDLTSFGQISPRISGVSISVGYFEIFSSKIYLFSIHGEIRIFDKKKIEVAVTKTKVDIFLSGGQFCIFFSKLERDIDLILFAS